MTMIKIYAGIYFLLCFAGSVFCQTRTWTWISGSGTVNAAAVFGTQGSPSTSNHPPAIYDALSWKDKNGYLWIYGGTQPFYNTDLWKFNPTTLEWTWVKGSGAANQPTVTGTKGVAAGANTPGQRSYTAPTWVDTSGALWLMGGAGQGDDMWKYDTGANMWTWMSGSASTTNSVHGTQGIAAA